MSITQITERAITSLRPYARNARTHSKKQVRQIAASIERFGFTNPVLISDDGEIVAGHGRMAVVSSSDVYRAHGRLIGLEPSSPDPVPLNEDAPLRSVLYPYRGREAKIGAYAHDYEKILVEQTVQNAKGFDWTILRLPKVYGPEDNSNLATVYGFSAVPDWRWTHGHVTNIAAAIAVAISHPLARNEIFNVGEATTPTMGERLARLPTWAGIPPNPPPFNYDQPMVTDTTKIRRVLGFADVVDESSAMKLMVSRQQR